VARSLDPNAFVSVAPLEENVRRMLGERARGFPEQLDECQ